MKAWFLFLSLAVSAPGIAAQTESSQPSTAPSPAEQKIAAARLAIQRTPQKYQPYNDLALALARRAEETSDALYCRQAEEALAKSFQIAPKNFEGHKIHVFVLLGEHEYTKALDEAKTLNHQTPDDVLLWGYLADAESALGDYDEAEKAAQWMINLRPDNVPGLLRGASLRAVWGDAEGAMEFLNQALQETPPFEAGDTAAILTNMANLQLATGKTETAEKLDEQALNTLPDYYAALESLARVRTAQHRYAEAVELLEKRNTNAPHPQNLYAWAEALERAGRAEEAKQSYARFEQQARQDINEADNANRELVFYYVDHTSNSQEALRIARLEVAWRHDVYTLDAYAWALDATGDYAAARAEIAKALAVGVQDAGIFYHAGVISSKLGDRTAAAKYLTQSLDLNPVSEVAPEARQALARLGPVPGLRVPDSGAASKGQF